MDKKFIVLRNYNNIKELMKQRNISYGQLAKRTGYSTPHIWRIINGQAKITTQLLIEISKIFNKGTSELFYGGEPICQ